MAAAPPYDRVLLSGSIARDRRSAEALVKVKPKALREQLPGFLAKV